MKKSAIILSVLLLSTAARAGWTPPVRISDQATSFGPRIVAAGDTLHVVYWRGGTYTTSFYLRSTDGGVAWSQPFHLADTSTMSNSVSPKIRISEGNVIAIWKYTAGPSRWNFGLRRSDDSGNSWFDILSIMPTDFYELQKHDFCISDGLIFFTYSYWDQEIIVEFKKSTNWGVNWTSPIEAFRAQETGNFDMVARGDTIHVVWPGRYLTGDSWETRYIKSTNGGDSWSDNLLLTTPDSIGSQDCCIIMNESGHLAVIWMDGKYSPNLLTGDLFVRYSYNAGEDWTAEEQLTFTHWARKPRAVWQGDSIHVVWEDWRYSQRDIFYMLSTDNGISWGEEQRIEDDPGLSLYPDLVVTNDRVHVVWRQDSGMDGPGIYYSRWENESAVWDNKANLLPEDFVLRAYPNPFNSKTIITYKNLKGGEIEIYNIAGQKIRTFNTAEIREGQIEWDARDALGNKITSGIYFARARGGGNNTTIKLLYLK